MLNIIKGWLGEKMTTWGMWLGLDKAVYHKIDNVIIPAHDGTTQIDHILVSAFGVFVVETKNFKGWIFGAPDDENWTQALFGQRYPFKNPLRQNYRHTKCLAEHLRLEHGNFHSVVFFIGECELKTPMPPNVMTTGLSSFIKSHQDRRLTDEQVQRITGALRSLKATSTITKSDHLNSLRSRHEALKECPRCGGNLVERTAKTGKFAGEKFMGCNSYPRCKFIRGA